MADDGNILIKIQMGADVSYPTIEDMIKIIERKNPVPDAITMEMDVPGGKDTYTFVKNMDGNYLYTLRRADGRISVDNKVLSLDKLLATGVAFKNQFGNAFIYKKPPHGDPHAGAGGGHAGAGGGHDPYAFGGAHRRRSTRRRSIQRRRRSTRRHSTQRRRRSTRRR